ncbi:MAG: ABC transporter permease subunit, partial [Rhodothermales bacterium]
MMILTPDEWEVVRLSLRVAAVAVVVSLPLGMALAYGLARGTLPLPFLVENLVQLPLVLPPVVVGLGLLVVLSPSGVIGRGIEAVFGTQIPFTWIGAALAAAIMAFPLMVQPMRVAFEAVDPEWEEAGYVYGGGRWAVFRHVTLPLAARGLV